MRYFLSATIFLAFLLSALTVSVGEEKDVPDKPGAVVSVAETLDELPTWETTWELSESGSSYKSADRELSREQVLQIRETVLGSEHERPLEGWDVSEERLAPEGTQAGRAGFFSFRVDLGGDPSITLSCENTRILGYLDEPEMGMIPNWKVRVGDRTWHTRSRKVTNAASLLCPDRGMARHAFYNLDARFENFESPLRESCQEWSGYSDLNRRLKLTETREYPTAIHFEFRALRPVTLTHVTWSVHSPKNDDNLSDFVPQKVADRYISMARRHGYYFDPQAGPNPTWDPLLAELEMAEKLVLRHRWIGRLREEGIIERVHLTTIQGLTMKKWPLEEEPDIQLELSGRGWNSEVLISDEGGQAFAPRLGPTMCTALALPGYLGRGPEFTPEGFPITYFPDDNGAAALIKPDGSATLLDQW